MSQLSPKSHEKSLAKAIAGSSCDTPPPSERQGAEPVHRLLTQQPPQPTPAFLLAIAALTKHLQLINPPQGLSHIRGWLGAPLSSCKVLVGAAAGACGEQPGMMHTPIP